MKMKLLVLAVVLTSLAACQEEAKQHASQGMVSELGKHEPIQLTVVEKAKTMQQVEVKKEPVHEVNAVVEQDEKTILAQEKAAKSVAVVQVKTPPVQAKKVKHTQKEPKAVKVVAQPVKTTVVESVKPKPQSIPTVKVAKSTPISAAKPKVKVAVLGDAIKGKKVAKKCQACHTFNQGGKNKTGPNLFGVFGRKQGAMAKFKYGSYLKSVRGVWDESKLRAWVADSRGVAKAAGKKAKMPPQKIKGTKADDLIAYLKTLQ